MAAPDAVTVLEALRRCGVEDAGAVTTARALLNALKITNPTRDRVSVTKLARVEEALSQGFALHCAEPRCVGSARDSGRTPLVVRKEACPLCGGSNTGAAAEVMLEACRAAGIHRVCVVGGSPGVRDELHSRFGHALTLTLVDGTQSPDSGKARSHVRGHDLTVICGGSELSHKFSRNYEARAEDGAVITVPRRGVEAIAEGITRHALARARKAGGG